MYFGGRNGLSLSKAKGDLTWLEFATRPYRVTTIPSRLKNGRSHFGMTIYTQMLRDGDLSAEEQKHKLMDIFGVTGYIVGRWFAAFENGFSSLSSDYFFQDRICKLKTVILQCEAYGYNAGLELKKQ